jgi:hypothetical protein
MRKPQVLFWGLNRKVRVDGFLPVAMIKASEYWSNLHTSFASSSAPLNHENCSYRHRLCRTGDRHVFR